LTTASHEVNDDGTALVDELYPDERWPRGHPPSMVTPPTPPSDKVPVEGQQGNDTLYLVLGVVLGVMVIVLLIFVVMCGMRQVHQRKQMGTLSMSLSLRERCLLSLPIVYGIRVTCLLYDNNDMLCLSRSGNGEWQVLRDGSNDAA
jgi:hypothetical protein